MRNIFHQENYNNYDELLIKVAEKACWDLSKIQLYHLANEKILASLFMMAFAYHTNCYLLNAYIHIRHTMATVQVQGMCMEGGGVRG